MPLKSSIDFFTFAFERAEYEQDDLVDRWKMVDTKAQATATIAGVIIAAAFVLVRNTALEIPFAGQCILLLLLVTLAAAIGFAVLSMRIRAISVPPTAEEAARMAREAIARPEVEYEKRYEGLLADHIDKWIRVLDEVHEALENKADRLAVAQWLLLVSVALAVGLIIVVTVAEWATKICP